MTDAALVDYAMLGELELITQLAPGGVDPNTADRRWTMLMAAARFGQTRVIRWLCKQPGVDLDAASPFGTTALMLAAAAGHSLAIKALLAAGANTDLANNRGFTALMLAAKLNRQVAVKRLVRAGAAINARNDEGETALWLAVRGGGRVPTVCALCEHPLLDLNARNGRRKLTAVEGAVEARHWNALKHLVVAGADPAPALALAQLRVDRACGNASDTDEDGDGGAASEQDEAAAAARRAGFDVDKRFAEAEEVQRLTRAYIGRGKLLAVLRARGADERLGIAVPLQVLRTRKAAAMMDQARAFDEQRDHERVWLLERAVRRHNGKRAPPVPLRAGGLGGFLRVHGHVALIGEVEEELGLTDTAAVLSGKPAVEAARDRLPVDELDRELEVAVCVDGADVMRGGDGDGAEGEEEEEEEEKDANVQSFIGRHYRVKCADGNWYLARVVDAEDSVDGLFFLMRFVDSTDPSKEESADHDAWFASDNMRRVKLRSELEADAVVDQRQAAKERARTRDAYFEARRQIRARTGGFRLNREVLAEQERAQRMDLSEFTEAAMRVAATAAGLRSEWRAAHRDGALSDADDGLYVSCSESSENPELWEDGDPDATPFAAARAAAAAAEAAAAEAEGNERV